MKTLNQLLTIPRFSNLTLLTTVTSGDLPVESVEITETPDIANYIPENTFILTTAMIFKENQLALLPLIDSLKAKQAAGLGIKLGRFLDTLDPLVIAYANQQDFPIVQIPSTIPLGRLLHQCLNVLWNNKTEQLSYALDIQKEFSDMLINDVTPKRFIDRLEELTNTPIILLSCSKNVLACSNQFSKKSSAAEFYVNQLQMKQTTFDSTKPVSFLIEDTVQKPLQVSCYPVEGNSYFPHYLVILNPEKIPYPVSSFVIDQANLVLSFLLYKNQKIQESLDTLKTDFFLRMIEYQESATLGKRDWLDLGLEYGLVKARHYRIVYISCKSTSTMATKIRYQEEAAQVAFQWLQEILLYQIKDMSLFKIKHTTHFALLIQHKLEDLEEILAAVSQELEDKVGIQLLFGIGNVYDQIDQVAKSFVEAKNAYNELLLHTGNQSNLYHYQPKGMQNLFEQMNPTDIHYFCESTLKELAYPTEDTFIELRRTLKYYLDAQCEVTQTAKALFVHRNTIKYRIERCAQILGKPILDPETNLDIRLALKLSDAATESVFN